MRNCILGLKAGKSLAGTQKSKQSPSLLGEPSEIYKKGQQPKELAGALQKRTFGPINRKGTELFSIPAIRETIALLPEFPNTSDFETIKEFLRKRLHYSSERTRRSYANYIIKRMFPLGIIDQELVRFATLYKGTQELRDVIFYRFCKAEPLMQDIILDALIPAMAVGKLRRDRIRIFLESRYGLGNKNVKKCAVAAAQALNVAAIAKIEGQIITIGFRSIKLASFAFILHSEFPDPAMYDIAKLENNRLIKALLWNPGHLVSSLYELRNKGIISKVSEIDNMRQFTTKWKLLRVVEVLAINGNQL